MHCITSCGLLHHLGRPKGEEGEGLGRTRKGERKVAAAAGRKYVRNLQTGIDDHVGARLTFAQDSPVCDAASLIYCFFLKEFTLLFLLSEGGGRRRDKNTKAHGQ